MIEWGTIALAVVGSVSVGELISLFTVREQKKGMKIDNKQKEDERWEKLADQQSDQITQLNERITSLNDRLEKKDEQIIELQDRETSLRQMLDATRTKCAVSELLKCVNVSCSNREPKLGTRQVDVETIMEETYDK